MGVRRDVLRGIFAIVEQGDGVRLVLQGFDPENRKLVYEINTDAPGNILLAEMTQNSPGMARPQEVKLESWYRRMQDDPV